MELEAIYDETLGWVRYTVGTPSDESVEVAPVNALEVKRKYTRKAQAIEVINREWAVS